MKWFIDVNVITLKWRIKMSSPNGYPAGIQRNTCPSPRRHGITCNNYIFTHTFQSAGSFQNLYTYRNGDGPGVKDPPQTVEGDHRRICLLLSIKFCQMELLCADSKLWALHSGPLAGYSAAPSPWSRGRALPWNTTEGRLGWSSKI